MPAAAGAATAADTPGTTSHGDARGGARRHLLAAPTEDERVAALQADDGRAAERAVDQQPFDLALRYGRAARLLADVDPLGLGRHEVEQRGRDEPVVDDDVRLPRAPARRGP